MPADILIVDDRAENILAMEAVLSESPEYRLFAAESGYAAIELVKNHDFALILLDLQMPGIDGYETAAEIKKLERGKNVPIVMVSAIYTEDPHVVKGYSAGAIDYLGKPFNPDVLRAKVGIYANLYMKSRQIMAQNRLLLEAERAVREKESTLNIIENMPVGVIVANRMGAITQMNREAAKIWGAKRNVSLGHYNEYAGHWAESGKALAPEDWALARAVEKGEVSQHEVIEIQCFDGSKKTILNSASPLHTHDGTIDGAVEVMQDISHRLVKSKPARA